MEFQAWRDAPSTTAVAVLQPLRQTTKLTLDHRTARCRDKAAEAYLEHLRSLETTGILPSKLGWHSGRLTWILANCDSQPKFDRDKQSRWLKRAVYNYRHDPHGLALEAWNRATSGVVPGGLRKNRPGAGASGQGYHPLYHGYPVCLVGRAAHPGADLGMFLHCWVRISFFSPLFSTFS